MASTKQTVDTMNIMKCVKYFCSNSFLSTKVFSNIHCDISIHFRNVVLQLHANRLLMFELFSFHDDTKIKFSIPT